MEARRSPWKSKASAFGNWSLLGDVKPGLVPEVPAPSFLEASALRSDPELPAPSSSVLSPFPNDVLVDRKKEKKREMGEG
ncbi:unnamed protein product [Coregonus sp. 'balchen']|nr:unnamed protein product [Coregonus sp. 'balchen']